MVNEATTFILPTETKEDQEKRLKLNLHERKIDRSQLKSSSRESLLRSQIFN